MNREGRGGDQGIRWKIVGMVWEMLKEAQA